MSAGPRYGVGWNRMTQAAFLGWLEIFERDKAMAEACGLEWYPPFRPVVGVEAIFVRSPEHTSEGQAEGPPSAESASTTNSPTPEAA